MLRQLFKWICRRFYKVEVKGLKNYSQAGNRVIIVANHISLLDGLLLAVFLPEQPMFAVNSFAAQNWFFKLFLKFANIFTIDPKNPLSTKTIISKIKENNKCVIFPEGRITTTGALMKIYEGPGMVADKAQATILPIRIDGSQYTRFSHLKGKVKIKKFPKITINILEPQKFEICENIVGKERRKLAGIKLYDIMSNMLFLSSNYKITLCQSLIEQSKIHGQKHIIAEDIKKTPITYGQLLLKSFLLGSKFTKNTKDGEYVGLLLPNALACVVSFFGCLFYGRVPAMLNYSTGSSNLVSACNCAQIKTVYTSKQFIETGKFENLIYSLKQNNVRIIYLEDIIKTVTLLDKIKALVASKFPQTVYNRKSKQKVTSPAVVLFTSGSEGLPKGVLLSHLNIQANRYQMASRVDFNSSDIFFNALPVFHSFGLTAGMILPILSGIKTYLYPSPLHYRIVPEMVYDTNATIMFGTDTFLTGYAKFAHPYDFYSIRYVFAGAEKLQDKTRQIYAQKYGIRLFEGYGATETAPVLSTNTPMHCKVGTVGRLLPGIEYKLQKVPGINVGGKLLVKGPNVMLGYLLNGTKGEVIKPKDGWYDTGDVVDVDSDGYISIIGRVKRFAKIAGEMVSLTTIEAYLAKLWPENNHAVVNIPDNKKGEAIVLVTDNKDAKRDEIHHFAKHQGIGDLFVPKIIKIVKELPVLGTGKIDYNAVKVLVEL